MLPFEYGGQQTLNPTSISGLSKKFLEACNNGNLSEVRECLEEGVDVNVQDEDGVSAAMIVMKNKNKNGVLWSQARMRIEMRLRCFLVNWQLAICN